MTPTALILTAVAVIFVIGLVAVIVERTEQRDEAYRLAAEAQQAATKAVNQAESFRKTAEKLADECKATQAANEILAAELACSDQIIHRLQNDALAAQMAASDADVIPLPVRDGGEPCWPEITRQIEHDDLTALIRATEEN